MMQYVSQSPARQLAFLKAMMAGGSGSSDQIERAPRVLRETLLFPYLQGTSFVTQVYKRGGWEAVTAAYKTLPQSTEQVLHADKFHAGEAPQKVALRDVSASLGKGWRMADHDVEGEWGLYLLLDEFLQSADASKRAAEGWGGDRYALFLGPNRAADVVVAHKTAWDTEADAREFFDSYVRRTTKRYGVEPFEVAESGRHVWKTKEGVAAVELIGSAVVIVEGVPDGVDAKSLLRLL
jgi:hypothetical protein